MTDHSPFYKVLFVDDDSAVLMMLHELFQNKYDVLLASSGLEAIRLTHENPDLSAVVLDIKMPEMDGIATFHELRKILPDIRVILHTAYPGDYLEDEIDKTEKPFDYVLKGDSLTHLDRSIRNAVETDRLNKDNKALLSYAESNFGLVGKSEKMQEVFQRIRRVAPVSTETIIFGETGTGKELVAKAIHYNSPRRHRPFEIFSGCNGSDNGMVSSELFGHEKGAFTSAINERAGKFELADGGTLFLDDIADLPLDVQRNLLRVLEDQKFQRVGGTEWKATNVRVISATNKNLEKLVESGKFRDDLYFRLKGITIELPPLRNRREDIPLLTEKFIERLALDEGLPSKVFDKTAINSLICHDWPGNVRELRHAVESLMVLTESDIITADDVNQYLKQKPDDEKNLKSLREMINDFTRKCIINALAQSAGKNGAGKNNSKPNIAEAARILHTDRSNLYKMIRSLKIKL